jgi:hypothetical protein
MKSYNRFVRWARGVWENVPGTGRRRKRHRARAEEWLSLVRLPARVWSFDDDL